MHRSQLGQAVSSDTPTSNRAQYWLPFATAASGSPGGPSYLRVTSTAGSGNWWSIADLRLYR